VPASSAQPAFLSLMVRREPMAQEKAQHALGLQHGLEKPQVLKGQQPALVRYQTPMK
jgi:hypothetical protein